jgi:hypothetical protein
VVDEAEDAASPVNGGGGRPYPHHDPGTAVHLRVSRRGGDGWTREAVDEDEYQVVVEATKWVPRVAVLSSLVM